MKPLVVLSCFDGISAGRVALERAGIKVAKYYASEIDPYAISITQYNYPDTIQLGDVQNWRDWDIERPDLIIGGSPCQGFSTSGRGLNFEDPRSKLYFTFEDIIKCAEPDYGWLLENVRMKKSWSEIISQRLEQDYIEINSALVSAQSRKRLYWTNIPDVTEPEDQNVFLEDIIDKGVVDREKSYCIDANYWKGGNLEQYFNKSRRQLVFLCGSMRGRYLIDGVRQDGKMLTAGLTKQYLEVRYDGKTNALTTATKDNNVVIVGEDKKIRYTLDEIPFRKLFPVECERLQTFPEGYTARGIREDGKEVKISNTRRYMALGNSWTVDVVAHLFRNIKEIK